MIDAGAAAVGRAISIGGTVPVEER